MPGLSSLNNRLSILSANVRGLQTNLGDLTHSFVLPLRPDIIAPVETFLNHTVPDNFGRIGGYTKWYRKDRTQGTFGGIAVCFKSSLHVQPLQVEMPDHLELSFFKFWKKTRKKPLSCVFATDPKLFLQDHLDCSLHQHPQHDPSLRERHQHLGVARSTRRLAFTDHSGALQRNAARNWRAIRRIAPLLDAKGCYTLYHSQVTASNGVLSLGGGPAAPPLYLRLLDRVQNRAQRLSVTKNARWGATVTLSASSALARSCCSLCIYKVHRLRVPISRLCDLEPRAVATSIHGISSNRVVNSYSTLLQEPNFISAHFNQDIPGSAKHDGSANISATACPAYKLSRLLFTDGDPTILVNTCPPPHSLGTLVSPKPNNLLFYYLFSACPLPAPSLPSPFLLFPPLRSRSPLRPLPFLPSPLPSLPLPLPFLPCSFLPPFPPLAPRTKQKVPVHLWHKTR
ncbi:hypothetical protein C7M84_015434 [Penaeus vannamei]|uniref:Uncharacterized protein n=1 Tax=Penaeus vannamei TaxID=6689 RepID=A0A3R7PHD5_PENVA|nr:hypothetical protein C7M84_015434 [Penaeus vannamei]